MVEKKQGRRSAQDAENTKRQIMKVATRLFCELGYERVSIRNISEKANVSHSLIRYHFGSKEQIWYAISDSLHKYMETYLHIIIDNVPKNATANVKLYRFSVQLLAQMLIVKQPIQLIADAVRQEDALFDYFIDNTGEIEHLVNNIADEYNTKHPQTPIKIWEIKWQIIMYAHSAASLGPFMKETWKNSTKEYDQCLLNHWAMFNQMMAERLDIGIDQRLKPNKLEDLLFDLSYPQE